MEIVTNYFRAYQKAEMLAHLFISRVHKRHSPEPGPEQDLNCVSCFISIYSSQQSLKAELIEHILQVRKLSLRSS